LIDDIAERNSQRKPSWTFLWLKPESKSQRMAASQSLVSLTIRMCQHC
jgi:hypothetical protein